MTALRRLVQLALAALLASALGGLVLVLALVPLGIVAAAAGGAGPPESGLAVPAILAIAFIGGGGAVGPAVAAAWLPAFAAGAALSAASRTRPWAARRPAWAAAGAAVALICWLRLFGWEAAERSPLDLLAPRPLLAPAFLLAGAAAGLAFRSAMAAIAPFLGLDEEEAAEEADEAG